MTDQTKCPHCGAFERLRAGVNTGFRCGTASIAGRTLQSLECCKFERDSLKDKVAAQQELLKEAADALRTLHHWSDVATHMGHATLIACRENAAEVLTKLDAAL